MVAVRLMSAADLAALPDDERGELLDGVMLPMTPVKEEHSGVVTELLWAIRCWLEAHRIGKVAAERGFLLRSNPDTVLAPDLSFVSHSRNVPDRELRGFAPLAPDLAVEVRSPANRGADLARKVHLYLEAGSSLVWVIDPAARAVAVHAPDRETAFLGIGDQLDGGSVLPGFTVEVDALFA